MKADEGKDAAPCQDRPAGEAAGHPVLQQFGANHTCAHKGTRLSRRTEVTWVLYSPHLSFAWPFHPRVGPCRTPQMEHHTKQDTWMIGQSRKGTQFFTRQCTRRRVFWSSQFLYVWNRGAFILSLPFTLSVRLIPRGRRAVKSGHSISMGKSKVQHRVRPKKVAYKRLHCHDSK